MGIGNVAQRPVTLNVYQGIPTVAPLGRSNPVDPPLDGGLVEAADDIADFGARVAGRYSTGSASDDTCVASEPKNPLMRQTL